MLLTVLERSRIVNMKTGVPRQRASLRCCGIRGDVVSEKVPKNVSRK